MSSPARGTWIEMPELQKELHRYRVVPRKGDVDRNGVALQGLHHGHDVPRKGDVDRNTAWCAYIGVERRVVPRKGDVDRNTEDGLAAFVAARRPPQGGRG